MANVSLGGLASAPNGQNDPVVALVVGPAGVGVEAELAQLVDHSFRAERCADLYVELLAGGQLHVEIKLGHPNPLWLGGAQSEVHALFTSIPQRDEVERPHVEVGTHLAVQHVENVGDERTRDTLAIVVRINDPLDGLEEIDAEQQRFTTVEAIGQRTEKRSTLFDVEVADRAAEERDDPTYTAGHELEVPSEVADDGVNLETGVALRQR